MRLSDVDGVAPQEQPLPLALNQIGGMPRRVSIGRLSPNAREQFARTVEGLQLVGLDVGIDRGVRLTERLLLGGRGGLLLRLAEPERWVALVTYTKAARKK